MSTIKRTRPPAQLKHGEIREMRTRLLEEQGGNCLICCRPPSVAVLDHHHTKRVKGSGKVRGVLCSNCNVLLAKVENNCTRFGVQSVDLPGVLRNMASYLEKPQLNLLHPSEKPKPKKLKKSSYKLLVKRIGHAKKVPPYPKSGKLTVGLEKLYNLVAIEPEFYK